MSERKKIKESSLPLEQNIIKIATSLPDHVYSTSNATLERNSVSEKALELAQEYEIKLDREKSEASRDCKLLFLLSVSFRILELEQAQGQTQERKGRESRIAKNELERMRLILDDLFQNKTVSHQETIVSFDSADEDPILSQEKSEEIVKSKRLKKILKEVGYTEDEFKERNIRIRVSSLDRKSFESKYGHALFSGQEIVIPKDCKNSDLWESLEMSLCLNENARELNKVHHPIASVGSQLLSTDESQSKVATSTIVPENPMFENLIQTMNISNDEFSKLVKTCELTVLRIPNRLSLKYLGFTAFATSHHLFVSQSFLDNPNVMPHELLHAFFNSGIFFGSFFNGLNEAITESATNKPVAYSEQRSLLKYIIELYPEIEEKLIQLYKKETWELQRDLITSMIGRFGFEGMLNIATINHHDLGYIENIRSGRKYTALASAMKSEKMLIPVSQAIDSIRKNYMHYFKLASRRSIIKGILLGLSAVGLITATDYTVRKTLEEKPLETKDLEGKEELKKLLRSSIEASQLLEKMFGPETIQDTPDMSFDLEGKSFTIGNAKLQSLFNENFILKKINEPQGISLRIVKVSSNGVEEPDEYHELITGIVNPSSNNEEKGFLIFKIKSNKNPKFKSENYRVVPIMIKREEGNVNYYFPTLASQLRPVISHLYSNLADAYMNGAPFRADILVKSPTALKNL
jgi:hypothetical protein